MSNDNRRLLNPNPNPERVLSIPVKKSDPVELYRPLRKLVATKYSESDAQKVESVLENLNRCRIDMVERIDLSPPMQRNCLIHYLKCLCMIEPLFTAISFDVYTEPDPITFVWYDALQPDEFSSQRSIQFEKASVLFNLGAICSQIGASCDHATAVGRHLAIDAFKDAAKFFWKLWKVYSVVAQTLHRLFSAQTSELKLQQQLDRIYIVSVFQQHHVSKHYRRVLDLLLCDSALSKYVVDLGWITHLHQKRKYFRVQARQMRSSILPKSKRPKTFKVGQLSPLEKLLKGFCTCKNQLIPKQQPLFIDLIFSEYSPFKIIDGGKLVAIQWDMPPPYPVNLSILSSSSPSHMLAIPLKKSEHLDLYVSLRNYFVLKYSESAAKSVEGFLEIIDRLRKEMQCDNLSLHIRRDRLIHYLKYLYVIETFYPLTISLNPPMFVWYNAFNPQQDSSQHNIHFEKASVLFNLGAICTQIACSYDLTTIQGHHAAMDALNDASHWFLVLPSVAKKASGTMDLSEKCIQILCEIITAQIAELKRNPHSHSDGSSLAGYPVSLLYQKAYDMSTSGPLAEDLRQSSIPEFLESKMKTRTSHVQTGPSDVIEQFLSGYYDAQSLLLKGCQTPCLDFLSEFGLLKITGGNIVANVGIGGDELASLSNIAMEEN
ncbi:hypothetical protein PIB30_087930 [Stylosanthes scabra]|uniref:BRO1 domain-containing protein n=1 Tax=Stylosanthes scabra TaxID=79078 RepID=A0ABU6XSX4_9FABA|nr:hypothetical protein [Stylosanthes scabra]